MKAVIDHIDKRIKFHTEAQRASNDPAFHSGAIVELVEIKNMLINLAK
jgi:hypothetical protein